MSRPVDSAGSARSANRVYVALHYLCLTKLMYENPAEAWRIVGETWGLGKHSVRWVIADNHVRALAMLGKFAGEPVTLLGLCERCARGELPDQINSISVPDSR